MLTKVPYSVIAPGGNVTASFASTGFCLGMEFGVTTSTAWLIGYQLCNPTGSPTTGTVAARTYSVTTSTTGTAVTGTDIAALTIGAQGTWASSFLAAPVLLTANQHYRATILVLSGNNYGAVNNFWTSAPNQVSGPLVAYSKANAVGNLQETFANSAVMTFPTTLGTDSNYGIDVIVQALAPGPVQLNQSVTRAANY